MYMVAPIVLLTVFVGVVLGLIQAIMQLQDQALPFAVKLVGTVVLLMVAGTWMAQLLMQFSDTVLANLNLLE